MVPKVAVLMLRTFGHLAKMKDLRDVCLQKGDVLRDASKQRWFLI